MEYTAAQRHWIWLSVAPKLSADDFFALLAACAERPERVWDDLEIARRRLKPGVLTALEAHAPGAAMDDFFEHMERGGIVALTHLHDEYPTALRTISPSPPTLFVRGVYEHWNQHMIAIVGSRAASREGIRSAFDIGRGLAENGVAVVSGLAQGIDTAAHEGCLKGRGRTIAVLGCGLSAPMDYDRAELAERIIDGGGSVVSEFAPSMPAMRHLFPIRNRIISGLSTGVLLVEGQERSGALITMRHAKKQRRVQFALPGSIYQANSIAPNRYLKEGAFAVTCYEDILDKLGWAVQEKKKISKRPAPKLDANGIKMVEMLKIEELSFDELIERTGLSVPSLNSLLTILAHQGIIEQLPGKMYRAEI